MSVDYLIDFLLLLFTLIMISARLYLDIIIYNCSLYVIYNSPSIIMIMRSDYTIWRNLLEYEILMHWIECCMGL